MKKKNHFNPTIVAELKKKQQREKNKKISALADRIAFFTQRGGITRIIFESFLKTNHRRIFSPFSVFSGDK
jgi:glycerophosphoryl diester phosphodiesterase